MDGRRTPDADERLTVHQKYWDAWLDLTRQSLNIPGPDGESGVPAADAWRKWWEAASHAAPPPTRDLFGRLVSLSEPYFGMAQKLAEETTQDAAAALDAWFDGLSRSARAVSEDAASAHGDRASAAFWELPLDSWCRATSALWPVPGDSAQATKTDALARLNARFKEYAERMLDVPAVGYAREMHEQYQGLARVMLAYLDALQEYNVAFARLAVRSVENLRKKLAAAGPDAADSLRRLYDLWVDACEEEYAAYAMSEEHARLYARLVGALAAVKRQGSLLLDETLDAANLPTRREIDVLQRRAHEARRAGQAMRAELEDLKRRVERRAPEAAVRRRPRRKAKHH